MKRAFRQWLAGLLSVALVFVLLPATAWAADFPGSLGGTGDADSPYQISTADELKQLSEYVNGGKNCAGLFFKLMTDIDLEGDADNQWTPIGAKANASSIAFSGSFDGGGHTISGLYIDNTSTSYRQVGLFGMIGSEGTVENLGVSGEIIGGDASTGGIAGENNGTITGCHGACTVKGSPAGGIVGVNHTSGTVSDCYNTGSVSGGSNAAGGIVGKNSGTVSGCYNTGSVDGGSNAAGGIVGKNAGGSITNSYNVGEVNGTDSCGGIAGNDDGHGTYTNCYFLADTADKGVGNDAGTQTTVVQKSKEDFRSLASVLGAGWTDDPFLGRPVLKDNQEPCPISGQGTKDDPFEISNKEELGKVRDYINNDPGHGTDQYFKLTADINLGGEGNEWTPIGIQGRDFSNVFNGTFDGGGFTVRGLFISSGSSVGLFGVIGTGGTVKNLTVEGTVTGSSNVAGIVGDNEGTVENCHNNCNVNVTSQVGGGVVGTNDERGTVTNCYNSGNIFSSSNGIGGIAGANAGGTVTNCYNTGEVTGTGFGGIVGAMYGGTVKDCYNTGKVAGTSDDTFGAIAGWINSGTVTNCYYLKDTADKGVGSGDSAGTTAKNEAEFASGEVAWLLQGDQSGQVWGQSLKDDPDEYPMLTDAPEKKVCKVTFQTTNNEKYDVKYTNKGGTVALPENPIFTGKMFDHGPPQTF